MKIGFNGRYLQDAVSGVFGGERCPAVEGRGLAGDPSAEKEHNYLAIVMPMRIY